MSAYLGERLSTVPLLKARSAIFESTPWKDAYDAVSLIKQFFLEQGKPDFEIIVGARKLVVKPSTDRGNLGQTSKTLLSGCRLAYTPVLIVVRSSPRRRNTWFTPAFTTSDLLTNTYLAAASELLQESLHSRGAVG